MIHGYCDLEGAEEISPGLYRGGIQAAMDGVLEGKYQPLEFRFFVGRHTYTKSTLDVQVLLGKYQPIACARSVALKQCISLPKPLWHEGTRHSVVVMMIIFIILYKTHDAIYNVIIVLELCGGELKEISTLEMMKRDDLLFEIIDEDDDDDDEDALNILDLDDDDDEDYYA
jgi:hypothetical protein